MIVLYHKKCGAHLEQHINCGHKGCERKNILLCMGCGLWITFESAKEEVMEESVDVATEVRKIVG